MMMDESSLPHRKRSFCEILLMDDDGINDSGHRQDYGAAAHQLDFIGDGEQFVDAMAEHHSVVGVDLDVDVDVDEEDLEGGQDEDNGSLEAEDGDEYELRFEGDMDPLAFAEEDESGNLPYQQFERLEYEALAARKRKALAQKNLRDVASASKDKQQDLFGASVDEIWESAGFGGRRRTKREPKKRGRKRLPPGAPPGSSKLTPEVSKKLGEANLLYATSKFDEAVALLKDVVRLAPNVPDSYHTLGLLYDAMGDRKKALNFYMIAAHLTPKDVALWKRLASWSMEQGNLGQVIYCLTKAVKADPEDVDTKWDRASLFAELQDYQKAADAFEQILVLRPSDVEVCRMVAKMQHKNGQHQRAIQVLEKLIEENPTEADFTAVNLLAELYMEQGLHLSAIAQIDHARMRYCSGRGLPLDLTVKAGLCYAHTGDFESAERCFKELMKENTNEFVDLITEVTETYMSLGEHERALPFLIMLAENGGASDSIDLKIAECYQSMGAEVEAIEAYHKVVHKMPEHVDARLILASLLVKNERHDEALAVLTPHMQTTQDDSSQPAHGDTYWWENPKVKVMHAQICYKVGKVSLVLETFLPLIQETLQVKSLNQKLTKRKKRLSKSVLSERVRWLEENDIDEVFHGFGTILSRNDRLKASRARRMLAKMAAEKEEKKAAALAASLDWESEEESDEEERLPENVELKIPPLPNLLKEDDLYDLLLQTCKMLAVSKRYWEALEIIHHSLRLGRSLSSEKRDELRALGAEMAYEARDVKYGYDCIQYMVRQRPYSLSMWNCYYRTVSRSENRVAKHHKFILQMRHKYPDCIPAMIIAGHQFQMISQPHGALREYLQAYKLQPEDPFINLCVGISFINLSLIARVNNRNQCILQGFSFLYKYQQLSKNSQESNFNLARAYHHVGLVHLAVTYYEKVLLHFEKDHPVMKVPHEDASGGTSSNHSTLKANSDQQVGYRDLRREAAHNLHLIYKQSGATHLARQVLMDFCCP
ncbi:hypothetical protein O6H91_19G054300 [Diphasiastrum complanatum]|uniref:Uncharacterized protein n=3 Tax=Diphasiastrum complanatum TaxID=34168 RepID=A0ACC2AV74_DIPCM|nr:hypothetical protein O6H91_19G054300 [Diphasiastrum complanatum]KAJ7521434.1 hypothetical protein O6H91_19G054300 [Diphasiastrum complanatum]